MKQKISSLSIVLLVLTLPICIVLIKAATTEKVNTLRTIAEKKNFLIGAAVNYQRLITDKKYGELLSQEFNVLTVENDMKFSVLQPQKDTFDFEKADKIIRVANNSNIKVRGHTLVWGYRLPEWLKAKKYTSNQMEQILKKHIQTVVKHYKGKIYAWDVINEALNDDGSLKKNLWYQTIGPDYIKKSLLWAHEADPDALLFINDYGISGINPKSNAMLKLVRDLKDDGIPIDGVGLQMHYNVNQVFDFQKIRQNMDRISEVGLQVHVTEFDVGLSGDETKIAADIKKQANVYSEALNTCIQANACTTFVIWGLTDKYTWMEKNKKPLVFDSYFNPKNTYYSLWDVLANHSGEKINDPIKVVVNNNLVAYGRQLNGHVYTQLRELGEAIGKEVVWNTSEQMPFVNGKPINSFEIMNGKTYVKIREAFELTDGKVLSWDGVNKKVYMY